MDEAGYPRAWPSVEFGAMLLKAATAKGEPRAASGFLSPWLPPGPLLTCPLTCPLLLTGWRFLGKVLQPWWRRGGLNCREG